MDPLSDVLRTTPLRGGVFLHAKFSDPWCLSTQVRPETCAPFLGKTAEIIPYHFVVEGRLRVQMPADPPFELGTGELVMFPRNDLHLLGGDLRLRPVGSDDIVKPSLDGGLSTIRLGGDGPTTRIVCGFLGGDNLKRNPVVAALPPALRLNLGRGGAAQWIRSTFSYAAEEIATGRIGSATVLAKISELLFVEAVRRYAEELPAGQTGWLAGLRDPYVSHALNLLHARPGDHWTADTLGREVALSRSALAERFNRLIGIPPMQYLTQWRMQIAAHELRQGNRSMLRLAKRVGYDSEAAFSRAFKRETGLPPAAWRRQAGEG
ncbi:AraC family transcriptional regulator [Mycolicibacterium pulveris]|uniref:AraC family transcriptional regulator n=1 Tax=Mycolicibacterium pulveris TaxID=36813 RepID=A0A7I7UT64_MYCPV|nr:AraC family transcriptional regulator [Mycolicibacterium pulveris]MCV6982384.1 AraC family transcriptional regulator [Mycolicibacterium pulveris]BBY83961.1 AraC family transcriptional regulator [Mycolicibacterium pulveris]